MLDSTRLDSRGKKNVAPGAVSFVGPGRGGGIVRHAEHSVLDVSARHAG